MSRLCALLLLGLAATATAQNPYISTPGALRPLPPGYSPAKGEAGGVLDVKPGGVDRNPTVEVNPTRSVAPSYTGGSGGYSLMTPPMNPYMYNPWGMRQDPMNGYLTGVASVTTATGQYWNQIEQARLTREESRRSSFETQRQQVELERWYEAQKPKTQDLIDASVRDELERARRDPPPTEVWSGKSLNSLMNNILKSPRPTSGPQIPLAEDVVRGLNLVDKSSRGDLSLAKDEGKIAWPESLQEELFDGPRDRFSKMFGQAMTQVNSGEMPDFKLVREMRKDLKEMETRLEDQVEKITPGAYLSGRRVLNQLKTQVAGMSDPAVVKSSRSWRNEVKTVADLVGQCQKGLTFGPSVSPGDERAYTAAYYALRNYERDMAMLARR